MGQDPYEVLTTALQAIGLSAYLSRPDQLTVSAQPGPAWPDGGNSFWLSRQRGIWHLGTWLPACYRIPPPQDVLAVCSACVRLGETAMYSVPDEIVQKFGLERVSEMEFEAFFPEGGHAS